MRSFSQTPYRGFTLIETIIVVALSASMMLALGILIYNFYTISAYNQAFAQSSGSANTFMRDVESLTLPADAVLSSHTFSDGTDTSSSTSLVLEIPSVDSSGDVIPNTFDYARFYLAGADAYRHLEADPSSSRVSGTKLLSSTVSALSFTYNNSDFTQVNAVTVDVQTQTQVKQDVLPDHLHEQIRLRNY
ncbi:MAG: prepilin-type N-terminal cleavage/methylation domain-containing protein [Minisyncoccota bacterium]